MRKNMILRAKTFKDWMKANFDRDTLSDIASHGADAGWPGLTYYVDTCHLYEHYKDEIWTLACDEADEMGMSGPLELIASFNQAGNVASADQFENLMTWFAAEEYARHMTD